MPPSNVVQLPRLRQLLAERFPTASRAPEGRALPTGVPAIDRVAGGLPCSALSEIVSRSPSCGTHLLLAHLLAMTRRQPARAALVDAGDQFDPQSLPETDLEHLLWVRCRQTPDVMAVADLLARDANLDLVVIDLVPAAAHELRRIPATAWFRLQRAVEQTEQALVVLSPATLVPSAKLRLQLETPHRLSDLEAPRPTLRDRLQPETQRQRFRTTVEQSA